MPDDYVKTADRMMRDAKTLGEKGAHRNACYLAGYVVECTLKVLLDKAGVTPEPIHDLESLHLEVAQLLLNSNSLVARYGDPANLAPTMLAQVQPPTKSKKSKSSTRYYCHWDPFNRYDGARWDTAQVSEAYLREADKSFDVIIQMTLDGVV